jgi:hypothetical protein
MSMRRSRDLNPNIWHLHGRWASVALSTVRREDLALGVVARIHRSKSQAGVNSPRRDATGGFDREPTGDGRIELVWIRMSALGS